MKEDIEKVLRGSIEQLVSQKRSARLLMAYELESLVEELKRDKIAGFSIEWNEKDEKVEIKKTYKVSHPLEYIEGVVKLEK